MPPIVMVDCGRNGAEHWHIACPPEGKGSCPWGNSAMSREYLYCLSVLVFLVAPFSLSGQTAVRGNCNEAPREDALSFLCALPTSEIPAPRAPDVTILLKVPAGTTLRVAVDRKVRIAEAGQTVSGKIVEPVYTFDQEVIPKGSLATGHVTNIHPIPARKRILSYASGNFSPVHKYELEFDSVILPGGERLRIATAVSPGIAEVVHLVAGDAKRNKRNAAIRTVQNAKEAGKARMHDTLDEIKSPGKIQRLKQMLLAQSPYRRQYLDPGTRFYASLRDPLDFGRTTRTAEQLIQLGETPTADSILHARLATEVSSATAQRNNAISAVLTEPLFSQDHHLLLPANSLIAGEVIAAKPARKFHRNGDLRVVFDRIQTPEGLIQSMRGSVEGVEADRRAGLRLDDEGGAQATDSKTRYLSTGVALLLAAAASRPDVEHGTTDTAGDPSLRAGAGVSGSGITGSLIALAARSQPVSIAFAAYGAGTSVYNNFLSRGRDVVFAKDTPLEIGVSEGHSKPATQH